MMELMILGCFLLFFGEAVTGTLDNQTTVDSIPNGGFIQKYSKNDQIAINNAIKNGSIQKSKWGQLIQVK